jgi:hypothetical protein
MLQLVVQKVGFGLMTATPTKLVFISVSNWCIMDWCYTQFHLLTCSTPNFRILHFKPSPHSYFNLSTFPMSISYIWLYSSGYAVAFQYICIVTLSITVFFYIIEQLINIQLPGLWKAWHTRAVITFNTISCFQNCISSGAKTVIIITLIILSTLNETPPNPYSRNGIKPRTSD